MKRFAFILGCLAGSALTALAQVPAQTWNMGALQITVSSHVTLMAMCKGGLCAPNQIEVPVYVTSVCVRTNDNGIGGYYMGGTLQFHDGTSVDFDNVVMRIAHTTDRTDPAKFPTCQVVSSSSTPPTWFSELVVTAQRPDPPMVCIADPNSDKTH